MKRLTMIASLLLVLGLGLITNGTTSVSAGGGFNCDDFVSREEAQETYNRNTNDPFGLDGPVGPTSSGIPGVVCENPNQAFNGPQTADSVFPPASIPPSIAPSTAPSVTPSIAPSLTPSLVPSLVPSLEPSTVPSQLPSTVPSSEASNVPSVVPSEAGSANPTPSPSADDLPGEIAPDAITVQAFAVVDDTNAPAIIYNELVTTTSGLSGPFVVSAAAQSDLDGKPVAPGISIAVIDEATGLTVDSGVTDDSGLVTLDGEYDAPIFIIVAGTAVGSNSFELNVGQTIAFDVTLFVFSGDPPASDAPSVAPTVAPSAAASSSAPVASSGGATTLPNTGSGQSSADTLGLTTLLLALFAGAAIAIGTTSLLRGRRG